MQLAPGVIDVDNLLRIIDQRAKSITHRCLRRREDAGVRGQRMYSKTRLRDDLSTLQGMVLAYNMLFGEPLPQDTLYNYSNAGKAIKELK